MSCLLKILASLVFAVLALAHLFCPVITVDPITIGLLCLAFLPWVMPYLKSFKCFGAEIALNNDLQKIESDVEEVGMLNVTSIKIDQEKPFYEQIAHHDPILALAGYRIELERKIIELCTSKGLKPERALGLYHRTQWLIKQDIIGAKEANILLDVIGVLNKSVHGGDVSVLDANRALALSASVLRFIEEKLSGK